MFEVLLLILIIVLVGVLANIAGFGGAIFLVPILFLFFSYELDIVIGTTLSAIFIPALFGFIQSWRRSEVDFIAGTALEIPTIIGAILGALSIDFFPEGIIRGVFGIIAIFVSLFTISETRDQSSNVVKHFLTNITQLRPRYVIIKESYSYKLSIPSAGVFGFTIGFLSGLLGVGGGWLKMPILIFGIGLPPIIASGTALFMLTFTSLVGGTTHILAGNWDLELFYILSGGLILGAVIGDKIKQKISNKEIVRVIGFTLMLIGALMLVTI